MDELKALWQQGNTSGESFKSHTAIERMIRKKALKTFFRIRTKVVIESVAFAAFLWVALTGLDAELNTLQVNVLLVSVILLGIINNISFAAATNYRLKGNNMLHALESVVRGFRKQRRFAILFTVVYFMVIFLFLLARLEFTLPKALLASILFISTVGVRLWVETRSWSARIREIDAVLGELRAS